MSTIYPRIGDDDGLAGPPLELLLACLIDPSAIVAVSDPQIRPARPVVLNGPRRSELRR
jgi:hypothetical protein